MSAAMNKAAIFIDGQNTYYALKKMGIRHLSLFDYKGLLGLILAGGEAFYTGYYVGQVGRDRSSPKSEKMYEDQQKFMSFLRTNIPQIRIVKGKIMQVNKPNLKCSHPECPMKDKPVYYEKGVDVRLAIDMVHQAIKDEFDQAYLLSSDSDLLPAVKLVQEYKKIVHYIGFGEQRSIALMKGCNSTRIITKEECERFGHASGPFL